MIWKRPKKFIKNAVFTISILSLFMAFFWVYVFYVWNNDPNKIKEYDLNLPNYYENHLVRLQTRVAKAKSDNQKLQRMHEFAEALKGITPLNQFFHFIKENNTNLIEFHLQKNEYEKALDIADQWQKDYPNDISAKFKYADALAFRDPHLELNYYQKLNNQYKDIDEITKRYHSKLLKLGKFDKAYWLAMESEKYNINNTNPKFRFYYKDSDHKNYSEESLIKEPYKVFLESDNTFVVQLKKSFKSLKGLRFDIDSAQVGTKISDIQATIKTRQNEYNKLELQAKNQLTLNQKTLFTTGHDPYFEFNLPKDVLGIKSEVMVEVRIKLIAPKSPLKHNFLNNKSWQLFYSKDLKFSENNSIKLVMQEDEKGWFYEGSVDFNTQYIRFDLPTFKNMKWSQIELRLNENLLFNSDSIVSIHHIEKGKDGHFVVTDKDPYVVFDLKQELAVSKIKSTINLSVHR